MSYENLSRQTLRLSGLSFPGWKMGMAALPSRKDQGAGAASMVLGQDQCFVRVIGFPFPLLFSRGKEER